jgi:hypothetical protein
MKTTIASALRAAALATVLGVLPAIASATNSTPVDRAAHQLALRGSVPVKNAGPYVEIGTCQIQVSVKLGQPSAKLPDGTWLYDHRAIEDSAAEGTLIVRFVDGRVSSLALATSSVVAALRATPKNADGIVVASH